MWLYAGFTLSYRDVEELLVKRGIETSYESVRRWVLKFGPLFARNLRRQRSRPTSTWHLDEMVVWIQGKRLYLWRAVERVHHRIYATRTDAQRDLFQYIEGFYNSRRLHSALGYLSPAHAERLAA